jgi:periplasmic divalent cation tolerance protein
MTRQPCPDHAAPDPVLDARLRELRARFEAALPQRIGAIAAAFAGLAADVAPTSLAGAQAELHNLAGSAGLFGFERIGAAAGDLEQLLLRAMRQAAVTAGDRDAIRAAFARLEAVAQPPSSGA